MMQRPAVTFVMMGLHTPFIIAVSSLVPAMHGREGAFDLWRELRRRPGAEIGPGVKKIIA